MRECWAKRCGAERRRWVRQTRTAHVASRLRHGRMAERTIVMVLLDRRKDVVAWPRSLLGGSICWMFRRSLGRLASTLLLSLVAASTSSSNRIALIIDLAGSNRLGTPLSFRLLFVIRVVDLVFGNLFVPHVTGVATLHRP